MLYQSIYLNIACFHGVTTGNVACWFGDCGYYIGEVGDVRRPETANRTRDEDARRRRRRARAAREPGKRPCLRGRRGTRRHGCTHRAPSSGADREITAVPARQRIGTVALQTPARGA